MTELTNLSIVEAKKLLQAEKISSVELTEAHIEKIHEHKNLNAFIVTTAKMAVKQAEISDEKIKNGMAGIIEGIPIAIKDIFCTKGIQTTSGSLMLKDFIPSYDATTVSFIYANGGICLGKTNMDEFAMGSSTTTSYFGNTINPWKSKTNPSHDLVPGGSSGGSAAAVAARMCMAATGSDTGGSIRQPAAFCGIVGIKPTYGRCSRWGMVAFASSLDQAGSLGRSVDDTTLLLQAMCGYDPKDSTSANVSVPDWSNLTDKGVKGMKIGIPKEYMIDGMEQSIKNFWEKSIEWLKNAGAEIVDISLPHTQYALPVYYVIAPAEASSNLSRYDGIRYGLRVIRENQSFYDMIAETRQKGFGDEVKRRLFIGTYVLSAAEYGAYYVKAQQVRRLILNDFKNVFESVDAILTPTAPSTAFAIGEKSDPVQMYLNDIFTIPASLAGLPTISVPVGLCPEDGLPLGMQIIGKHYDEETVIRVGKVIENYAEFKCL